MPELKQFRLPDVGEGLVEAEIVSWKVAVGDVLEVNTVIVEIETAKSLVELPSPYAGVVAELLVTEGSTVDVGSPIITVDVAPGAPAGTDHPGDDMVPRLPADASEVGTPAPDRPVEPGMVGGPVADPAPEERTPTLVGYGPRTGEVKRRARKGRPAPSAPSPELQTAFATDRSVAQPVAPPRPPHAVVPVPSAPEAGAHLPSVGVVEAADVAVAQRVLAKPPVRKLARDLGVDLAAVAPSGAGGVVTRDDVLGAANGAAAEVTSSAALGRTALQVESGEREERIPVKGVRKVTAEAMVRSAFTAPHVTEFLTLDVSRTMKLVRKLAQDKAFEGVRVSPLLVVAKALLVAVERNPGINAAWDEAAQEIVLKRYVNLGIAAATPRGLMVPNIKDAQALSLRGLADALAELVATARAGRTQPAEMSHGTISITNVGPFGVDAGTPILNPGETAILCLGAIARRPWVHRDRVVPRWVTTLSLSFDHRLVDGELGSRFLADLGAVLHDPRQLITWG